MKPIAGQLYRFIGSQTFCMSDTLWLSLLHQYARNGASRVDICSVVQSHVDARDDLPNFRFALSHDVAAQLIDIIDPPDTRVLLRRLKDEADHSSPDKMKLELIWINYLINLYDFDNTKAFWHEVERTMHQPDIRSRLADQIWNTRVSIND